MRNASTFALVLALTVAPRLALADQPAPAAPAPLAPVAIPAPLPPAPEPRPSRGLFIAGLTTMGVGVSAILAGAVVVATTPEGPCNGFCIADGSLKRATTGYAMVGIGTALAVPGVIMTIVGAPSSKAQPASGQPAIAVGPRGGSLTWRF